jgi:hypothetical protein
VGKWRREGDSKTDGELPNPADSQEVTEESLNNDLPIGSPALVEACSELAEVVQAWPTLHPALRAAIMAIIQS